MTDFFESFSDEIEDNAGAYAALGGLAALKGQEIRNKKLDEINAQLMKIEDRVEREALIMRKLVDFESKAEIFTDETNRFLDLNAVNEVLESEGYMLATCGIPSNSLTELESIRFAKKTEIMAKQFADRAYIAKKYIETGNTVSIADNLAYKIYELTLAEVLDLKFKKNSAGHYYGDDVTSFISKLFEPSELDFIKLSEADLCDIKKKYKESFMQENSPICVDFTKNEIVRVDLTSLEELMVGGTELMDRLIEFAKSTDDCLNVDASYELGSEIERNQRMNCQVIKFDPSLEGHPPTKNNDLIVFVNLLKKATNDKRDFEKLTKNFDVVGPLTSGQGFDDYRIKCNDVQQTRLVISKLYYYFEEYRGKFIFNSFSTQGAGNKKASGKEGTSCFVATAVYGDRNHPQVQKLRNFRDAKLNKSIAGRHFIKFYYFVGPTLSLLPRSSKLIKSILKHILDRF